MRADTGPPSGYLIALAAALLLALLKLPYAYYQFLRLLTCGLAAWAAVAFWRSGQRGWAGAWLVLAVVYNPAFPLYLGRGSWMIANAASAVFVSASAFASHVMRRARMMHQGGKPILPRSQN